jgi:isocitrate lyase
MARRRGAGARRLGAGPERSVDAVRQGRVALRRGLGDEADLKTYGDAVAEVLEFRAERGRAARHERRGVAPFAAPRSFYAARRKAKELGVDIVWDCEHAKTPRATTR